MFNMDEHLEFLNSPTGQRTVIDTYDTARELGRISGVFTWDALTKDLHGDSHQMIAVVERLIELQRIREIPTRESRATQHKIYELL